MAQGLFVVCLFLAISHVWCDTSVHDSISGGAGTSTAPHDSLIHENTYDPIVGAEQPTDETPVSQNASIVYDPITDAFYELDLTENQEVSDPEDSEASVSDAEVPSGQRIRRKLSLQTTCPSGSIWMDTVTPSGCYRVHSRAFGQPANCWKAGTVCWDDLGRKSCHLNCCSRNYVTDQATGKDVCAPVRPCWAEGTVCWDDQGPKSCQWRCCSGDYKQVDGADRCTKPVKYNAVVGYAGPVGDDFTQRLIVEPQVCFPAGRKCWNNNGADSCWLKCCSRSYHFDTARGYDVCDPIPASRKCYAQMTPCWDANPVPNGKFFTHFVTKQRIRYPSCFACCARAINRGWTEWYRDMSGPTHSYDWILSGLAGMSPAFGALQKSLGTNDPDAFDGNGLDEEVVKRLAQDGGWQVDENDFNSAITKGSKALAKILAQGLGASGPLGAAAGLAGGFLAGALEAAFAPQWDMCN